MSNVNFLLKLSLRILHSLSIFLKLKFLVKNLLPYNYIFFKNLYLKIPLLRLGEGERVSVRKVGTVVYNKKLTFLAKTHLSFLFSKKLIFLVGAFPFST